MSDDPSRTPRPAGKHQRAEQGELRDALRDVIDYTRQEESERRAAQVAHRERSQRQTPLLLLLVALMGTLAWIWIARPASVFGAPSAPVVLTPERAQARARYALFLQRARVEAYRAENGRYPAVLRDAGPVEDGVSYSASSKGFVLEHTVNGKILRLDHAMRADSFLGGSLDVLRRR